jgi:hypothetical protein
MHFLAFQNNRSGVWPVESGKDLYQGGFARAVVADQCQYFSLMQLDTGIDKRGDGAKALTNVAHFEDDRSGGSVDRGNGLGAHPRLRVRSRLT